MVVVMVEVETVTAMVGPAGGEKNRSIANIRRRSLIMIRSGRMKTVI